MIDYDKLDEMINDTRTIDADLDEIGVIREQALKLADDYISEVKAMYNKCGIKEQHKALMIEDICSSTTISDDDRLQLVCDFAADSGLLFSTDSDDNKLACWLRDVPLAKEMYRLVNTRKEKSRIMQNIAKCSKTDSDNDSSQYLEAFNLLVENGYADGIDDLSVLKDNLADIEHIINTHSGFDKIAPFVYYQALVRNSKKMLEKPDYQLNPESIFKYQKYSIDTDNGKNFDTYTDYLQLYIDLLDIFPETDKELCEVCYLATSNLGSWNFDNADAEDMPLYIDDAVGLFAMSVFDNGLDEFRFFKGNDFDDDAAYDYLEHHPQLPKIVAKKLDGIKDDKIAYILGNAEANVKELSIENPIKPEKLYVFQTCCYFEIMNYVDNICYEMIKAVISDKPGFRR